MKTLIICLAVASVLPAPVHAQLTARQKNLIGLPAVKVVLTPPDSVAVFNLATVRTAIELRLRSNGIRVLDVADTTARRTDLFYVDIQALRNSPGYSVAVKIDVHVDELAQLLRKKPSYVYARIWDGEGAGGIGLLPKADFEAAILPNILAAIDAFVNDYLAANPHP